MKNFFRQRKGFTLIELLTVVVIVGILAAVVVPRFLEQRDAGEDAHTANLVSVSYQEAQTFWQQQPVASYKAGTTELLAHLEGANPEISYKDGAASSATPNQVGVTVAGDQEMTLDAYSDSGERIAITNNAGDETKVGFPGVN